MKIFRRHFAHLSNERLSPEDICRDFDNLWRFMKLIGADEKIIQEIKDLNKQGLACDYYDIELERILNLLRTKTQSKKEPLKYKISFNYKPIGPFPLEEILRKIQSHEVTREWYICPPNHPEKSQWPKIDAIGNQEINKALAEAEKKFKTTNKKPDNQHPKKEETKTTTQQNQTKPPPQAQNDAQTYKIGDKGPAGGIVFYEKRNNSGGWRYMEAAPLDLQPTTWGCLFYKSVKTEARIGSGKQNTELIVEAFNQLNKNGSVAQLCKEYTLNGYDDWFLPSKDELNQLYVNLEKNNLGDFENDCSYWSSTIVVCNSYPGAQKFSNGCQTDQWAKNELLVRPVRYF